MKKEIYLDNSATTQPYTEVVNYMAEVGRDFYGNPSSLHTRGIEAENLVKKSRTLLANALKVDAKNILFTSGGTESNNTAILGYLKANPRAGKHIITSEIEHPSVLEVFKQLSEEGYRVDFIPVDSEGVIQLNVLKEVLDEETALISIIHTNNETGTIQPISEVSKLRDAFCRNAVFHVDGVQAFGKMPIHPISDNIDLLSFSAHKVHGPKGVGALYIRKGIKIKPLMIGGGQEGLLRSGTENVPGICGFGLAAEMIFSSMAQNSGIVKALKEYFLIRLRQEFTNVLVNSPEQASPYIINISFPNVKSEVLLHHLEQKNIFVSTGSACSSRRNHYSHVLKAMGISPGVIDGAIRISLSAFNTQEDMDSTLAALKEIIPIITRSRNSLKHR